MKSNSVVTPVKKGQRMECVPDGKGKNGDLCFSIDGFMVFIKQADDCMINQKMEVEIISVKQNCAIAVRV